MVRELCGAVLLANTVFITLSVRKGVEIMVFELPPVLTNPALGMRAAELVIDGLSVCCFNSANPGRFWEVAYPRPANHELQITIQQLNGADQPVGQPVIHRIDARVDKFSISLTNGSLEHYNQFPHGGPADPEFHRMATGNDRHDLGWLIDLKGHEIGHGNFVRLMPRHPSRPISLANIRHSLFCVLKPEDEGVRISPRRDNDPNAPHSFPLGRTNTEVVGVLLATRAGDIRFDFLPEGLNRIDPLPYDQNRRYHIDIINSDTHDAQRKPPWVRGDLHLFYNQVIEVDGTEKELWAIPGGRFAPDGDCHSTGFGGATLEPLIQP
jgi:hypothetical protein